MTILWTIATCLYAVYVLGRIAHRKVGEARLRGRTSGEIVRVKETEARSFLAGTVRATHVFVQTDDRGLVVLTNPPYQRVVVGDRVSRGALVSQAQQD